jgi:hypothetical protein
MTFRGTRSARGGMCDSPLISDSSGQSGSRTSSGTGRDVGESPSQRIDCPEEFSRCLDRSSNPSPDKACFLLRGPHIPIPAPEAFANCAPFGLPGRGSFMKQRHARAAQYERAARSRYRPVHGGTRPGRARRFALIPRRISPIWRRSTVPSRPCSPQWSMCRNPNVQ